MTLVRRVRGLDFTFYPYDELFDRGSYAVLVRPGVFVGVQVNHGDDFTPYILDGLARSEFQSTQSLESALYRAAELAEELRR
jgi:hypothetical protein